MSAWRRLVSARESITTADQAIQRLQACLDNQRSELSKPSEALVIKASARNTLNDLRSALDYLATDIRLACCSGSTIDGYFPICRKREDFCKKVRGHFPGLIDGSQSMHNLLESMQPYNVGYGWLLTFNTLVNDAKHDDWLAQALSHP